ncbi:MAG: O-antigen ligase family protein [Caulobacterales bacterium]
MVNRRQVMDAIDLAMMVFWFFAASSQFSYTAQLLMAGLGYFVVRIAFHWRTVLRSFCSSFAIWLVPAIALASVVWSTDPNLSLRAALQLAATALIACYFATRMKLVYIVGGFGLAAAIILAMNAQGVLTSGEGQMFRGGFDQKNFFASRVTPALIVAAAFLAYLRGPLWLRAVVAPVLAVIAAVGALAIFKAESATAMVAAGAAVLAIIGAWVFATRSVAARGLFLSAAFALVAGTAATYVAVEQRDPVDVALSALGKDRSLTGRTQIWAAADRAIAQRPILGHGYQAFWWTRQGILVKQRQFVRPDQPFYFHNTFLEHRVAMGTLGLIAVIASMLATVMAIGRAVLARADLVTAFFLGLTVYAALRAYVEVDLYRPFEPLQTMFWVACAALPGYVAARYAPRTAARPVAVPA